MMQSSERCLNCNASMKAYWHTLTPGVVSALVKLLKAVHYYGRNSIHIHDEMKMGGDPAWKLTDFEWNNMTKLRFHGLAHQDEKAERAGYWLITARGGAFLRGQLVVPKRVLTFRNGVVDHSKELAHIDDFRNKTPFFEKEFAYETPQTLAGFLQKGEQTELFKAA